MTSLHVRACSRGTKMCSMATSGVLGRSSSRSPCHTGTPTLRVPWELSRCQHLPTLGMAYAATGDSKYAAVAVAHIDDWIVANAPGYGVNWACTMDVAIRAVNWLWAYHLVADAPQITDEFIARLLSSLLYHGRHIAQNIERYEHGITTNHTLADYVGLLYLGLLLPEFSEASQWTRAGYDGVLGCMRAQVATDGVHYENSLAYHRLVLEMFAGCYVLARHNGHSFPDDYGRSLERMFEFVQQYLRPDGLAPLVGDSDDGRLQVLSDYFDWNPQDHRYLLTIGAALFDRDDFAAGASRDGAQGDAVWLVGQQALERSPTPSAAPRLASHAFPESGRFVMRHRGHHALICTDEAGTAGKGNHKHNDILSLELSVSGTAILIDPGSFVYTSNPPLRDCFRSTGAHNTIVVDGIEQNEFKGVFGMRTDARVRVARWLSGPSLDVLEASHTGYMRLSDPVIHQRTIAFAKERCAWLVMDRLIGSGEHIIDSFLHFAPEGCLTENVALEALRIEAMTLSLCAMAGIEEAPEAKLDSAVSFRRDDVSVLVVPLNVGGPVVHEGWVAPRYGQRVQAPFLKLSAQLECPASLGYLLIEN